MTQQNATPVNRSPNGTNRQVMLLVRPEEREALEKAAREESRTISAMGRILLLKGMEACGIKDAH